jgi:hypothetical protein
MERVMEERRMEEAARAEVPQFTDPDERPLNVGRQQMMDWDVDPTQRAVGMPGDGHIPMPEPLASDDKLKLGVVIAVFGEEMARCSRSENRVLRQYALMKCAELLPEMEPTTESLNAAALLVQLATEEKVPLVYECGMRLLRLSFDTHQDLTDREIAAAYEPVVLGLRKSTDAREPKSSKRHTAAKFLFRHAADGLLFCSKKDMLRTAVSKAVSEPIVDTMVPEGVDKDKVDKEKLKEKLDKEKLALIVSGRMELLAELLGAAEGNLTVPGDVSVESLLEWIKEGDKSDDRDVQDNTRDCIVELGQQLQGKPQWKTVMDELEFDQAKRTEIDNAVKKTAATKAQLAQARGMLGAMGGK